MISSTIVAGLGLAGLVSAAPLVQKRTTTPQNVVYWGQNSAAATENNDLSAYCTSTSGIDILVLAFLENFGGANNTMPSGTIGEDCVISPTGEPNSGCAAIGTAITSCQASGKKVFISVGGATGNWDLVSSSQATDLGNFLWNSYGKSDGSSSSTRPFGSAFVNGFDFDIESVHGNSFLPDMVTSLRSNFAKDSSNTYYVSGAPQCPTPEPNIGSTLMASVFDYLWIQFYNNAPTCGLPGAGTFNFDDWVTYTAGGQSKDASLFVGVPAAPLAATGAQSGASNYLDASALAAAVNPLKSNPRFGGIMMWDAAWSDSNKDGECTFAMQANAILTGQPCANSGSSGSSSGNTTSTTTATSTSTSAPTSTVVNTLTSSSATAPVSSATSTATIVSTGAVKPSGTASVSVSARSSSSSPAAADPTSTGAAPTSTSVAGLGYQCAGTGFPTKACASGLTCKWISTSYSQCVSNSY